LELRDFKTSKDFFKGEKETFNIQKIIYELAAKHLYPDIKNRRFRFLFLKFPKNPWQDQPSMTDDELTGFEYYLTGLQAGVDNFTEANVADNLALFKEDVKWLCGREGIKKDGNPMWMCSARKPLDYFVALDQNGEITASGFTKEELKPKLKEGHKIEPRHYPGCTAFFSKDGRARNFN
jgi:hypothetical protein